MPIATQVMASETKPVIYSDSSSNSSIVESKEDNHLMNKILWKQELCQMDQLEGFIEMVVVTL